MSDKTGIEYLDATWNPISMTCTPVSEGCANCWHLGVQKRFGVKAGAPLDQPMHWKKPRRIGVQFMGDLFHDDVSLYDITEVFQMMWDCPLHTFMVLTKRPLRMTEYAHSLNEIPKNVWFGVSIENQSILSERIERLCTIESPNAWLSVEPMLGPVYLSGFALRLVKWVVCGAESGGGARKCDIDWVRDLRDQCIDAGIPFFYKQGPGDHGYYGRMPYLDGQKWDQYPEGV